MNWKKAVTGWYPVYLVAGVALFIVYGLHMLWTEGIRGEFTYKVFKKRKKEFWSKP